MAKQIRFINIDKKVWLFDDSRKQDIDNYLKDKQVINVETLKTDFRFWYYKED